MSLSRFLKLIDRDNLFAATLAHHERIPAQPARYEEPITPLSENILNALAEFNVRKLYSHQARAIDLVRTGHNLVAITPTASGKSMLYNIPVVEMLADSGRQEYPPHRSEGRQEHSPYRSEDRQECPPHQSIGGHALYIFPLKALEQDQAAKLKRFIRAAGFNAPPLPPPAIAGGDEVEPALVGGEGSSISHISVARGDGNCISSANAVGEGISVGIYDGDTPQYTRSRMRKKPPSILITNPDMLHLSVLSYHSSWEDFLRGLRFVILDELHVYRGIFGSHILHVLHRLDRLCRYYGASPQYIAASATIAGAKELAEDLTGHPFEIIEESGAPIARRHFLFFNPVESYLTFALKLFAAALNSGLKTIVFTKARRTTELLHRWMTENYPDLAQKISSYRAGFLVEERREIEQKLMSGELSGVISTSALELGIDIGGLDVCILVGYPGTISSTWQRAGRVGRGSLPSCVCLVAGQDQLDQYFIRNPADFFARPVEKAIVDSSNAQIATPHLLCAAQEIPISKQDVVMKDPLLRAMIEEQTKKGMLLLGASGDRWFAAQRRPQRSVNVRTAGNIFSIELKNSNEQLGTVSGRSVYAECHPNAIYLHRAEQYLVTELDLNAKRVNVRKTDVNHYTIPLFEKETEILEELNAAPLPAGNVILARMKVTEQLVGYQKRRVYGQQLISQHELEFEPTSYETVGLVIAIPETAARMAADAELHFRGGIHGVEHALLALAPLFALCDRNDMGGYSAVSHPHVDGPAVFLYDGYPGGIGLSARLFDVFNELVIRTLKLVRGCPCDYGCPSCIHSPKCGHGNVPLDKAAAIMTLEVLAGEKKIRHSEEKSTQNQKYTPQNVIKPNDSIIMKTVASREKSVSVPQSWSPDKSGVVFDLETQRSADEVGGWGNIKAMGLAWAVVYKFPGNEWLDFAEKDVEELIGVLKNADVVVGFNQVRFDYEVLRGYSGFDFRRLKSYDMLVEVQSVLSHRLKLNSLASATLGSVKSADGIQSLRWWKNGEVEKVAEYCRRDVEVTRDLFFHILEHEYLLFEKKGIGLVRIPLKFDLIRL